MSSAFALATLVGFPTAAYFLGRFYRKKDENENKETINAEKDSAIQRENSLRESTEKLATIQRIREFFSNLIKEVATTKLETISSKIERYETGRLQHLENKAHLALKYEAAITAGNLKEKADGTYEVLAFPGLTKAGEQAVRLSVERDNRYILKVDRKLQKVESKLPRVNKAKDFYEQISNSSLEEITSRFGAHEEQYDDLIRTIREAFSTKPEEASVELLSEEASGYRPNIDKPTLIQRTKAALTPWNNSDSRDAQAQLAQQERKATIGDTPFAMQHTETYKVYKEKLLWLSSESNELNSKKNTNDMTMEGGRDF